MVFDETAWYSRTSSTQTMKSWARRPESPEELPEVLRSAFSDGQTFPSDPVFLPGEGHSRTQNPDFRSKLVGFCEDCLVVWEEEDGPKVLKTKVPFSEIRLIQRGVVLLSSWLEIWASHTTVRIPFASVNEILMDPFLRRLRDAVSPVGHRDESDWESGRDDLDRVGGLHFKFMSYGRRLLRLGDKVVSVAYQPERSVGWRKIASPFLTILTDRELIVIRDPEHVRRGRRGSYGGVFDFFPLSRIDRLDWVRRPARNASALEVVVKGGPPFALETAVENEEFRALIEAFPPVPD